jgi:hypothetical protein
MRLVANSLDKESAPIVFAWVVAAHQFGAVFTALGAGALRASIGAYTLATIIFRDLCVVASLMMFRVNKPSHTALAPAG